MTAEDLRAIAYTNGNDWTEYNEIQKLLKEAAERGLYRIEYLIKGERDCGFVNSCTKYQLQKDGIKVEYVGRNYTTNMNTYSISFW